MHSFCRNSIKAIFNSFNFNLPPDTDTLAVSNSTGFETFLNTLICPSDSDAVLITLSGVIRDTQLQSQYRLHLPGGSVSRGAALG